MNTLHPALAALAGGVLIGLASWLLLASLGRIAGISSITSFALAPAAGDTPDDRRWRIAFLVGLMVMGALATLIWAPPALAARPMGPVVIAGLLVGFGTVLGSGCTSGHGVCGLGRGSARSLVATLSFMSAGAATVAVLKLLG